MSMHVSSSGLTRWGRIGLLLGLTAVACLLALRWRDTPLPRPMSHPAWPSADSVASPSVPTAGARAPTTRDVDEIRRVLWSDSFAGTHPVGNWCVAQSTLSPCPELRDRFEYYLNGLGLIDLAEVRLLIEDEARQAHGPAVAQAIMVVFDKYWDARNHRPSQSIDMAKLDTWMPALQDMQRYRVQVLGEAWAQAFYGDEDRDFVATYQRALSGLPLPPTAHDPVPMPDGKLSAEALLRVRAARYGDQVAHELAQLDEEQARFDQTVARAQAEWQRLLRSAEMSDAAREQAIQTFIAQQFKPVDRRRAEALVKLTPP